MSKPQGGEDAGSRFWTVETIARIAAASPGGAVLPPSEGVAQRAPFGFGMDSRAITPGQVFVALRGESTDGHRHVAAAAAARASMAIVAESTAVDPAPPAGFPVVAVGDPIAALARLATAYRDALTRTLVVAVTGSAGKTTTTRLIAAALGGTGRLAGTHPAKSFNNSIGVPLTILNARPDDGFLVCEVGTSAPGEIATLARIVRPDVAVITSIGRAHIEKLGSVEGVAREKSDLLRRVRDPVSGLALVPTPCEPLDACLSGVAGVRRFGRGERADVRLGRVEMLPEGLRFEVDGSGWFSVPMLGEHNAMNALAAVAVARHAGLSDEEIRRGLVTAKGAAMRLERRRIGGIEVINDAYNANPESMRMAIETLAALGVPEGGRRVLVLGDMLELGSEAARAHREVAAFAASMGSRVGLVCAVGAEMADAARAADRDGSGSGIEIRCEPVFDDAAAGRVAGRLRPGDIVLLKGSRGTRVERVLEALESRERVAAGIWAT